MRNNDSAAHPNWAGVAIVAALAVIYVSTYAFLFSLFGYVAGVFSTAPVVAAAWFFGARAGLTAGALTFPVNLLLEMAVADRPMLDFVSVGGLLGSGAEVFVGLTIGYLRDLKVRAEAELARRTRAESGLRAVQRQLLNVQETERRNLARELHDDLGGELVGLKFLLEATDDRIPDANRKAGQLLDTIIEKVRDLSLALRPSMLDDLGLLPALQWQVQRMASEGGIPGGVSPLWIERSPRLRDRDRHIPHCPGGPYQHRPPRQDLRRRSDGKRIGERPGHSHRRQGSRLRPTGPHPKGLLRWTGLNARACGTPGRAHLGGLGTWPGDDPKGRATTGGKSGGASLSVSVAIVQVCGSNRQHSYRITTLPRG